jgi:hypothetical protein
MQITPPPATLCVDSTYTINWTGALPTDMVEIYMFDVAGWVTELNVVSNIPNTGSYTWTVQEGSLGLGQKGFYVQTMNQSDYGYSSYFDLIQCCQNLTIDEYITECDSFTWSTNGNTYFASGIYIDSLSTVSGCDSVVRLNLTINNLSDLTTSTSGATITSNNSSATYQWLDCDNNNSVISSETGQSFTPTANGNYAVELTENGCIDTSACVNINTVGIIENSFGNELLIYPNPTSGNFSIDLGASFETSVVTITDISGKLIDSKTISQSQILNLSINEPTGIYFITIQAGDKKAVIRLIKK